MSLKAWGSVIAKHFWVCMVLFCVLSRIIFPQKWQTMCNFFMTLRSILPKILEKCSNRLYTSSRLVPYTCKDKLLTTSNCRKQAAVMCRIPEVRLLLCMIPKHASLIEVESGISSLSVSRCCLSTPNLGQQCRWVKMWNMWVYIYSTGHQSTNYGL